MVDKLDQQTIVSEFDSHWLPLTSGLVSQLSLENNQIIDIAYYKI